MSLKLKPRSSDRDALFDTVETPPSAWNYGKHGKYVRVNSSVGLYNSQKSSLAIFDEEGPLSPRTPLGASTGDDQLGQDSDNGAETDNFDDAENKEKETLKGGDELDNDDEHDTHKAKKFGTFDGVLGRCLLCMWGVIMFLRTGWIVGNAGIWQTTVVMVLSASITMLTTLSLSALCTNGEITHGGPYLLISRSLGPQWGGVIGLLFAAGNCVGVALHLVGFAEALVSLWDPIFGRWDIVIVAEIGLCFLLVIALFGVEWIIKFNLFLLFLMFVSIIAFFIGTFIPTQFKYDMGYTGYSSATFAENWGPAYMKDQTFLTMVAIFFPSVTGCMAGANISGDLKKPSVNIPVGTSAAVIFSMVVYVIIAWMLGACVMREVVDENGNYVPGTGLYHNYLIMSDVSLWRPLVDMGIYASTFSSATSCFVAAPRIFKAMCDDDLYPIFSFFAKAAKNGEPVRAYFLVVVICGLIMISGDINFIAPMVTNFFLITYALVNYSVFAWDMSKSPGWRPSFKYYNKWVALFATVQAMSLMFLVDWIMALVTAILSAMCYWYIGYRDVDVDWGTTVESKLYQDARKVALKYQRMNTEHAKITRPTFLMILYDDNREDVELLYDLAKCLNFSKGLIFIGNVIVGDLTDPDVGSLYEKKRKNYKEYDLREDINSKVLWETCVADTYAVGTRHLLQTTGMGGMRPNVFMLKINESIDNLKINPENLSYDTKAPVWFTSLRNALLSNLGVIMIPDHFTLDEAEDGGKGDDKKGTIDIWWLFDDGGLTILTGYLLTKHKMFKNYKLRIMALDELGIEDHTEMVYLMNKLRISCHIEHVKTDINDHDINHRGSIDDMRVHIMNDKEEEVDAINRSPYKSEFGDDDEDDAEQEQEAQDDEEAASAPEQGKKRKISEFAHKKMVKYRRIGKVIEKYSANAKLCLLTMPYPRAKFEWWEYSHIIHDLTPKNHGTKTMFVRGTQDQVLTFCF